MSAPGQSGDQVDRNREAAAKDASPDKKDPVDTTANTQKSQGITKTDARTLKVAGATMNEGQRLIANTILAQAGKDNASPKTAKAMMVAAIGESNLDSSAVDHVYHTHKGVFQSNVIPPEQVATQAHYFLIGGNSFRAGGAIGAVKNNPSWSVGRIAAYVEISDGSDAYYDGFADEADAIIAAYGGVSSDPSETDSSRTVATSYQFTRGTPEDQGENSWDAAQRLTGEVTGWALFAVSNRFYYFSEQRLIRQAPILTIDRTDERVLSLRGTLDNTGNATEASMEVICDPFAYHAGEVVRITGAGPFSTGKYGGRWIISETRRARSQPATELTLRLPAPKGIEPAHDTSTSTTTGGGATVTDATVTHDLLTVKQLNGHPKPHDNVSQVAATIISHFGSLVVTSSTDHSTLTTNGNVSNHVSGQAVDLAPVGESDPAGYMLKAAKWIAANLISVLAEGIHNTGLSVKDGKTVPATYWGGVTWAQHANHIHIAVLDSQVLTEGG